jgi:hypothetical protein
MIMYHDVRACNAIKQIEHFLDKPAGVGSLAQRAEMATQAIEIAQNGRGKMASRALGRRLRTPYEVLAHRQDAYSTK